MGEAKICKSKAMKRGVHECGRMWGKKKIIVWEEKELGRCFYFQIQEKLHNKVAILYISELLLSARFTFEVCRPVGHISSLSIILWCVESSSLSNRHEETSEKAVVEETSTQKSMMEMEGWRCERRPEKGPSGVLRQCNEAGNWGEGRAERDTFD